MRARDQKSALRRELKQRLEKMRKEPSDWMRAHQDLSSNLKAFLEDLLDSRNSTFILGTFAPLADEPQWPLAFGGDGKWWSEWECATAFPRPLPGSGMSFRRAGLGDLVEDVGFGVPILVPSATAPEVVPDALLVPALGLAPDGKRLGRGKGYYDRYLENYRGLKIGIVLDEMVVEGIPTDSHDVDMDVVVTSRRIFRKSKSP